MRMQQISEITPGRLAIGGAIALVTALAIIAGLHAPSASAQIPAVCDQYPSLPQCQDPEVIPPGTPPGDQPPGDAPGGTATPASVPTAAAAPGTLPFTGYPITALLLLLLILLLAGLTIRAYLALHHRVRGGQSPPPGGSA